MQMRYAIKPYIFLFILWVGLILGPGLFEPVMAGDTPFIAGPAKIVIFISKNIRPYIEAADGMRDALEKTPGVSVETVMLERFSEKARKEMAGRFLREPPDLLVAIGPEAAKYIWKSFKGDTPPKIYAIILNPEKVIGPGVEPCGIPLNIPAKIQLAMIKSGLPPVRRIGIFYDPKNNSGFFDRAEAAARGLGISLIPLKVSSRKDIPSVLAKSLKTVDCIWLIPDRTVISESIAQYIIKQAVLKDIPVVGYNRFFYESGAAMSFVFDYATLGIQTAALAKQRLIQHQCDPQVPVFKVWLNRAVIERLGIEVSGPRKPQVIFGP